MPKFRVSLFVSHFFNGCLTITSFSTFLFVFSNPKLKIGKQINAFADYEKQIYGGSVLFSWKFSLRLMFVKHVFFVLLCFFFIFFLLLLQLFFVFLGLFCCCYSCIFFNWYKLGLKCFVWPRKFSSFK